MQAVCCSRCGTRRLARGSVNRLNQRALEPGTLELQEAFGASVKWVVSPASLDAAKSPPQLSCVLLECPLCTGGCVAALCRGPCQDQGCVLQTHGQRRSLPQGACCLNRHQLGGETEAQPGRASNRTQASRFLVSGLFCMVAVPPSCWSQLPDMGLLSGAVSRGPAAALLAKEIDI